MRQRKADIAGIMATKKIRSHLTQANSRRGENFKTFRRMSRDVEGFEGHGS